MGIQVSAGVPEGFLYLPIHEQLLFHPERTRHQELSEPHRRGPEIGLEDALELEDWLVVEADVGEILRGDPGLTQAVRDGACRKAVIPFLSRESLFRGRRHDLAVPDQGRRAVVIEGRNAEDV